MGRQTRDDVGALVAVDVTDIDAGAAGAIGAGRTPFGGPLVPA